MGYAVANCIIAIAVNLALGAFVLLRAPRERVNRIFCLITLAITLTAAGELLMRLADSGRVIMLGARIGATGWFFLGSLFAHFSMAFTGKERLLRRWQTYVVLYAPPTVMLALAWATNLVYRRFTNAGYGFHEVEGLLRYPASIIVVCFFVAGLVIVWDFWRNAPSKSEREDAFLVMASAIFMLAFGLVTDVILIYFTKQNPPVNILTASMIMAMIMGYAVTRRGFLTSLSAIAGGAMISIIRDPVLVLDSNGAIDKVNPAMAAATGFEEGELLKKGLEELLLCEGEGPGIFRRIASGGISGYNCECRTADGGTIPVNVSSGVLRSRSARRLGSVVVLHDMRETLERARAEEQAKIALVEAEAERKHAHVLRDIIDVAGHELRSPAAIFRGYANLLTESYDTLDGQTVRQALDSMDLAAGRVEGLANSLLDASSLASGEPELSIEESIPSSVVKASIGAVKEQYPRQGFSMVTVGAERPFKADVDMIESVLVIILDNAAKFSAQGSEVRVRLEQDDAQTTVSITDQGPGIPEEYSEKVFERFFQVADSSHHSVPGLGLGLFIARRVVEAHGGRIWVRPAEGGGSVFGFSIPFIAEGDDVLD